MLLFETMRDGRRAFGVSRKTGYKLLNRHCGDGAVALCDRPRRPVWPTPSGGRSAIHGWRFEEHERRPVFALCPVHREVGVMDDLVCR